MTVDTLERPGAPSPVYDVDAIRADFPILSREVYGKPLTYLDNGASAQKPQVVLDAVHKAYSCEYANVHRGLHYLSNTATDNFEAAREIVRRFLNAPSTENIVFTRNATEAINLVAQSFGGLHIGEGDEIVISIMEHHSNIVPWHFHRERNGAVIRWAPIDDDGNFLIEEFEKLLSDRTRIVAITHVSNALGTINPVKHMIEIAHRHEIPVMVDGAQAVPHMRVDVRDLDCEFYAFSGHKMFAPTGIGVLYGKEALLEAMPPYQGGGDMIKMVTFERTVFNDLPYKFEAGTPNIAGTIGLGAAVDYLDALGMEQAALYEQTLLDYAVERLDTVPGLRFIGTANQKASVVSFVMDDIHPHDLGTVLDHAGIAVRAGHHCAMPVMQYYGVPATTRASMAFYNTTEEVERLYAALLDARKRLA